jgi:hypothetical protein
MDAMRPSENLVKSSARLQSVMIQNTTIHIFTTV